MFYKILCFLVMKEVFVENKKEEWVIVTYKMKIKWGEGRNYFIFESFHS